MIFRIIFEPINFKIMNYLKVLITLLAVMVSSSSFSSEAENSATVTKVLNITENFTGLSTSSSVKIVYTQNNKAPVAKIKGPAYAVEEMTYKISGSGVLYFVFPENARNMNRSVEIELNGGLLYSYATSSSSSITVTTPVNSSKPLKFDTSSSSRITMNGNVNCTGDYINIFTSSSSRIVFNGNVICRDEKIKIDTSSSSSVLFEGNLESNKINIDMSSSSRIKSNVINVKDLKVSSSSVGTLDIRMINADKSIFSLSSGGGVEISNLRAHYTVVNTASGADFSCKTAALGNIELSAASGSSITLKGKAKEAKLDAVSGGELNLRGFDIGKITSQSKASRGAINL